MRELKFRAWEDRMSEPFTLFDLSDDLGRTYLAGFGRIYNPVIMQYTGRKDKNGKEIYEGDIIKTHFDKTEQYEAYTEIGEVNITPFRTEIEDKKHGKYNKFYSHSEVIGNVYENPNLLT